MRCFIRVAMACAEQPIPHNGDAPPLGKGGVSPLDTAAQPPP